MSRYQIVARHAAMSGLNTQLAEVKRARDYANLSQAFTGVDALDPEYSGGAGWVHPPVRRATAPRLRRPEGRGVRRRRRRPRPLDPTSDSWTLTCYAYVPDRRTTRRATGTPCGPMPTSRWRCASTSPRSSTTRTSSTTGAGSSATRSSRTATSGRTASSTSGTTVDGQRLAPLRGLRRHRARRLPGRRPGRGQDGTDGGAYAGMAVVNAANVRGMGAGRKNQHSFLGPFSMPNLSSLDLVRGEGARGALDDQDRRDHVRDGVLGRRSRARSSTSTSSGPRRAGS